MISIDTTKLLPGMLLLTAIGCGPSVESFVIASDIPADSSVEVPRTATQIVVSYGSGQHTVTFFCDTPDVERWATELQKEKPELNPDNETPYWLAGADEYLKPSLIAQERETFKLRIGSDAFSEDMLKYQISLSARGETIIVWHNPKNSQNFLWTVYH